MNCKELYVLLGERPQNDLGIATRYRIAESLHLYARQLPMERLLVPTSPGFIRFDLV